MSFTRTRTKFKEEHVELIKRHCRPLIEGLGQLSAAEVKRTFKENILLAPLLKLYGFKSIRIKIRTERNKYHDENF